MCCSVSNKVTYCYGCCRILLSYPFHTFNHSVFRSQYLKLNVNEVTI